jgi:hypothetical protein
LTGRPGKWAGRPGSVTPHEHISMGNPAGTQPHQTRTTGLLRMCGLVPNRRSPPGLQRGGTPVWGRLVRTMLGVHTSAGQAVLSASGRRNAPAGNCVGLAVPRSKGNKILRSGDAVACNVPRRQRQSWHEHKDNSAHGQVWSHHHPSSYPPGQARTSDMRGRERMVCCRPKRTRISMAGKNQSWPGGAGSRQF